MEANEPRRRASRSIISRRAAAALVLPVIAGGIDAGALSASTGAATAQAAPSGVAPDDYRSLDGSDNNLTDPSLGQAGEIYPRVVSANYADGVGAAVPGPAERYLSNRIFNDTNQNVFSGNGVTHWAFVWGQFIDHTIGLRQTSDEELLIAFDPDDPLETFVNELGRITTTRSAMADGTGVDSPRQQVNTVSSYIDAWAVYGGSDERLDWLHEGPVDGDPTNNEASLLTENGYLPTASARAGSDTPTTDLMGRLYADPSVAVVAGDTRANENIGLTAIQTLMVREHNRIVAALPDDLDEETKFQTARRVVAAPPAVHHVPRVPSDDGRRARRLHRVRPHGRSFDHQ